MFIRVPHGPDRGYAIDAPAIHAAGVAEGRAAIVTWARAEAAKYAPGSNLSHLHTTWTLFADAIEAAFPTTGEKTDG